jgi:hypothetical protein
MPPIHHTTSQTQKGQQQTRKNLKNKQNNCKTSTEPQTTRHDPKWRFFSNFEHKIITHYYPIEKADLKKHKMSRSVKANLLIEKNIMQNDPLP